MKKNRIFWGVLFIALAIFLIVSQLGILDIHISIWTLILTIFFGVSALWSLFHKEVTGFLFSIAFLIIIYDKPLGLEAITPWTVLLAALLMSIGWHFLFPSSKKHSRHFQNINQKTMQETSISIEENMSSCIRYIDSQEIENVSITNRAGMIKVYFHQADMKYQNIDFHLYVTCGMLELYIPRTWKVIDDTDNLFSHVSIEEMNSDLIEHCITLKGKVHFSEIKISYL